MNAIALHSVIPVRAEARESSEQNTQMLFGECCTILEEAPKWKRIRLDSDGQEGWMDAKMITVMSDDEYAAYSASYASAAKVIFPMAYAMSENNGQTIPLTAGTKITNYQASLTDGVSTGRFEVLGVGFRIDPAMVAEQDLELNEQNLLQTVRFFLNIPYLWGGKNALGMDCSGFTQTIMSLFGKRLLRNASEQAIQGTELAERTQAQAGDLIFFDHHDGKISHVGIAIDSERVIHCSGRVKVENWDDTGIYSAEQGEYTHHLVSVRRI